MVPKVYVLCLLITARLCDGGCYGGGCANNCGGCDQNCAPNCATAPCERVNGVESQSYIQQVPPPPPANVITIVNATTIINTTISLPAVHVRVNAAPINVNSNPVVNVTQDCGAPRVINDSPQHVQVNVQGNGSTSTGCQGWTQPPVATPPPPPGCVWSPYPKMICEPPATIPPPPPGCVWFPAYPKMHCYPPTTSTAAPPPGCLWFPRYPYYTCPPSPQLLPGALGAPGTPCTDCRF